MFGIRAGDTSSASSAVQFATLKTFPNHYDPDDTTLGLEPVDLELVNYPTKSAELEC